MRAGTRTAQQDAATELSLTIDVTTNTGVSEDILKDRIAEAFDQLGIQVTWEPT